MFIIIEQEKGKSIIDTLNEKMATISKYLGLELTEVLDYSGIGMDILASETHYYTLHTNGLFSGGCDYSFTTNGGIYNFGLTLANLI